MISIQFRRIEVAIQWLRGNRNGVTISNLVTFELSPFAFFKAIPKILNYKLMGDYRIIYFKGIPRPIFLPSIANIYGFYGVIAELTDKKNWHYYEIPETRVRSNDIVVDLGASEGLFTLLTYSRVNKVYAIEPLPMWVGSLRKTFESASNVEILPYGVSRESGVARIISADIGSTIVDGDSNIGHIEIRLISLDDIFHDKDIRISYIKADIEGFEEKMLEGAKKTISKFKPRIAITTYHEGNDVKRFMEIISDACPEYKFKIKGIEPNNGRPMMLHAWVD